MLKRIALVLTCFFLFSFVLILNFKTPMIGEDYGLSITYAQKTDALLVKLPILFHRIANHMGTWNARLGEQLAIFFLGFDKAWFNILNTIAFLVFCYLVVAFGRGELPAWSDLSLYWQMFAAGALIILAMPVVGELFFWLTGSANYLWSLLLLLLFFLPYRLFFSGKDIISQSTKIRQSAFFLLAFFSGLSNENTVPVVLFCIVGFMVYKIVQIKRFSWQMPKWYLPGGILLMVGYLLVLFAPSTRIRMNYYMATYGAKPLNLNTLILRTINYLSIYWSSSKSILLLAFASLLLLTAAIVFSERAGKKKTLSDLIWPGILVIASFISIVVAAAAPYFEVRSAFITYFFILALITYSLHVASRTLPAYIPLLVNTALVIGFVIQAQALLKLYDTFYNEVASRHYSILLQVENGAKIVEVHPYATLSSTYLTTRDNWLEAYANSQYPAHYGIDSIKYSSPAR